MDITAALTTDLAALTEALEDPGVDLAETLRLLGRDTAHAVDSYLGLSVTITGDGHPITFTALREAASGTEILSSVQIPLIAGNVAGAGSGGVAALILYASKPGAFVDLAADLAWITGRPLSEFVIDQHLSRALDLALPSGLGELSMINQAIGMLIRRGYRPELARAELDARAARSGTDRTTEARRLLGAEDGL